MSDLDSTSPDQQLRKILTEKASPTGFVENMLYVLGQTMEIASRTMADLSYIAEEMVPKRRRPFGLGLDREGGQPIQSWIDTAHGTTPEAQEAARAREAERRLELVPDAREGAQYAVREGLISLGERGGKVIRLRPKPPQ